jgi:hypothetical protein
MRDDASRARRPARPPMSAADADPGRRALLAGAFAWLAAARPSPAVAQAGSIDVISTNPRVIAAQLRQALNLSQQAVRELQQLGPTEPLDAPMRTMNRVYALIRFAHSGMDGARGARKFPDPIEDLQYRKVTDAFNISRRPLDEATSAYPRDEFIQRSIHNMSTTVTLLQQVVALLP